MDWRDGHADHDLEALQARFAFRHATAHPEVQTAHGERARTMRLFAYKMTHDSGFAPNPFWGFLTLATCKPGIRRSKCEGDWVAGFTSKALCGHPPGEERLVFLMQVDEKVALADYFRDGRFQSRIPRNDPVAKVYRCGDNIYRPLVPHATDTNEFEQLPNGHHGASEKARDLGGMYALIATRFAYFGAEPLRIPSNLRPDVPRGQSSQGTRTHDSERAKRFIDYVFDVAKAPVMARPHQWPRADASWHRQDADVPDQENTRVEDVSQRSGGLSGSCGRRPRCPRTC
ncbi:MAG: hypothetical protein OXN89_17075 [Bryobacterales bacterium]|nr:hypothetical protein [Bryobacterales bacterium]